MRENEVSGLVLKCASKVHTRFGPGLLESVNETALAYELQRLGLAVETQRAIPVVYEGIKMACGFRADIIVEGKVVVEVKSVEVVPPVAYSVLLTYIRLAGCRLGLPINFGEDHLKDGFRRVVDRLPDYDPSAPPASSPAPPALDP